MTAPDSHDFSWLPLNKNVRVLAAHECGIFALEKPAGTMTHPNAPGVANAKNAMLVADYSMKSECFFCRGKDGAVRKIFVLNRLDSPTSGIVLCSENELTAQLVRQAFLENRVRKTYRSIVCGNAPAHAVWRDWLIREKTRDGSLRVKIAAHSGLRGAQFAETEAEKIRSENGFSELKLFPRTGRTHQLRVQCATRGLAIAGDKTYGNETAGGGRLFLHAEETQVVVPWRGKEADFLARSPLPPEFGEFFHENADAPRERFRIRVRK